MDQKFKRKVYYYKNFYKSFFIELAPEVQRKFNWTLDLISNQRHVPTKYLRYINESAGLYEVRVEYESNTYRVFCFFDSQRVILLNGFQKKSAKTPKIEIAIAQRLKKLFYDEQ